jgi:hypothetical protein
MKRRDFVKLGAMTAGAGMFPAVPAQAQPPQVTITFKGLMAFVRWRQRPRWDVLFVDSRQLQNAVLPDHAATITATEAWVDADNSDPDGSRNGQYYWNIGNDEITILRNGSEIHQPSVQVVSGLPEKACPATATEAKDIQWLAKLSRVCGTGNVKRDYVEKSLAAGTLVPSRMRLTAGTLECARDPVMNPKAVFRVNRDYQKSFADVVNLVLPAGSTWTLKIKNFATGHERRAAFKMDSGGRPPVVNVDNTPPGHPPGHNQRAPVDHFAAYYELLATAPQYEPIPRYVRDCNGNKTKPGSQGAGLVDPPVYCPPPEGEYP